jgi:glucose-6-phosphate 1-dehydrogenase
VIERIVLFGAGGDLTGRYLLPAIARLEEAGRLPDGMTVFAVGRSEMSTEEYRRTIGRKLDRHAPDLDQATRDATLARLDYRTADATSPDDVRAVVQAGEGPLVAYLALPPGLFADAIQALAAAGLPEGSRIVVEKPFGEDLESARELNDLLHEVLPERDVFRIDHFLQKQTVQNVLGLRFANRIFEPLWNARHIEQVEITWDETLALEGRAGYYDGAGALRDMIQNHLLQLLCFVAMEPPATFGERDLRDRKVEVLRAVRRLGHSEVGERTARARYTAGRIDGQEIPDYAAEEGVDPERETETFAQVTLAIDNWRWSGVPFILRSGKALGQDARVVNVRFLPVPHLAFGQTEEPVQNELRLQLDPDRIALLTNVTGPAEPFRLDVLALDGDLASQELPAYARLLLDVLDGDVTLSIRDDEAEESWRIIQPIMEAWRQGTPPLGDYEAGSSGP